MNKVVIVDTRLFMAVVGPSGIGKTELIFQMVDGKTFQPRFEKVYYFYREYQDSYDLYRNRLNIEFVPVVDFDFIETLRDSLLIFDDSCAEIYQEQRFANLVTAAWHRNSGVIYVKQKLYHQSKFSKTIDLNATHIILFKSSRDLQQIRVLGSQLGCQQKFLEYVYNKATEKQYGHLLIDLDPKTSDVLRFSSSVVPPAVSIFYLPSAKAVVTPITNGREARAYANSFAVSVPS